MFPIPDVDAGARPNWADNCPFVANNEQRDQDLPAGSAPRDNGTRRDGIGDACDPNPNDISGHYHAMALTRNFCIGVATPDCSPALDSDGDAVANRGDNCVYASNARVGADPAAFAQSQRDLNADGFSDISDISSVAGAFGTQAARPA